MKKATHFGSCQCCGREQKLPEGRMSIHGYTVQWNVFMGTCCGARELPYEQSCELIKGFIERAEKDLASLRVRIEELLQPATEPKGYVHVYGYCLITHESRYQWLEVDILEEIHTYPDYVYKTYSYKHGMDKNGKDRVHQISLYGDRPNNTLEVATLLNKKYVEQELRGRERQLVEYISWQTRRVKEWVLTPLKPIDS